MVKQPIHFLLASYVTSWTYILQLLCLMKQPPFCFFCNRYVVRQLTSNYASGTLFHHCFIFFPFVALLCHQCFSRNNCSKELFFIKYCLQPKEPGVSPFSVMADNCIDQVLQPISRIASNIFMCTAFFNLCGICLSFVKCSFAPNLEIVSFLYIYSYNLISKIFSQLNPIFVWF